MGSLQGVQFFVEKCKILQVQFLQAHASMQVCAHASIHVYFVGSQLIVKTVKIGSLKNYPLQYGAYSAAALIPMQIDADAAHACRGYCSSLASA